MKFEEGASVKLICAVLRDHQNLRTGVSAVCRIIGTRLGLHFLYRFLVWCNHRAAAPRQGVNLAAIDLEGVAGCANSIGLRLSAVFHLEDTSSGTASVFQVEVSSRHFQWHCFRRYRHYPAANSFRRLRSAS